LCIDALSPDLFTCILLQSTAPNAIQHPMPPIQNHNIPLLWQNVSLWRFGFRLPPMASARGVAVQPNPAQEPRGTKGRSKRPPPFYRHDGRWAQYNTFKAKGLDEED
jgi:hypothetical protein